MVTFGRRTRANELSKCSPFLHFQKACATEELISIGKKNVYSLLLKIILIISHYVTRNIDQVESDLHR